MLEALKKDAEAAREWKQRLETICDGLQMHIEKTQFDPTDEDRAPQRKTKKKDIH